MSKRKDATSGMWYHPELSDEVYTTDKRVKWNMGDNDIDDENYGERAEDQSSVDVISVDVEKNGLTEPGGVSTTPQDVVSLNHDDESSYGNESSYVEHIMKNFAKLGFVQPLTYMQQRELYYKLQTIMDQCWQQTDEKYALRVEKGECLDVEFRKIFKKEVDIVLMESKCDDCEEYSSRIYDILRCVSIGIAFEDPSTKRTLFVQNLNGTWGPPKGCLRMKSDLAFETIEEAISRQFHEEIKILEKNGEEWQLKTMRSLKSNKHLYMHTSSIVWNQERIIGISVIGIDETQMKFEVKENKKCAQLSLDDIYQGNEHYHTMLPFVKVIQKAISEYLGKQ